MQLEISGRASTKLNWSKKKFSVGEGFKKKYSLFSYTGLGLHDGDGNANYFGNDAGNNNNIDPNHPKNIHIDTYEEWEGKPFKRRKVESFPQKLLVKKMQKAST